ncbi:MAG: DUF1847 domain-containing protein [bacterium]
MYTCAECKDKNCRQGNLDNVPQNCPCRDDQDNIKALYKEEVNLNIAYNSALVESEGYCQWTRLEEIMQFAKKCGFNNLGVAFCIGLKTEALTLVQVLRKHGFTVNSVVCKNGSIPKEFLGIKEQDKLRPTTYEPMCNPIGQAVALNKAHTDLNIILGLCVGHDTLFIKHSEAPVTVMAVKDRVLGHNPMAALYLADSYYKKKLHNDL